MARTSDLTRRFTVTTVNEANKLTGETFRVPGLDLSVRDIRALVRHRRVNGVVNVLCDVCGQSVADCDDIRPLLSVVPEEWTLEATLKAYDADDADQGAETRQSPAAGARHADGLVVFTG